MQHHMLQSDTSRAQSITCKGNHCQSAVLELGFLQAKLARLILSIYKVEWIKKASCTTAMNSFRTALIGVAKSSLDIKGNRAEQLLQMEIQAQGHDGIHAITQKPSQYRSRRYSGIGRSASQTETDSQAGSEANDQSNCPGAAFSNVTHAALTTAEFPNSITPITQLSSGDSACIEQCRYVNRYQVAWICHDTEHQQQVPSGETIVSCHQLNRVVHARIPLISCLVWQSTQ